MENPNQPIVEDDTTPKQGETIAPVETVVSENEPPETGTIDAPYGFRKDGTPAKKRGRKPAGDAGIPGETRERLESVTQAPPRRQSPPPTPQAAPIAVDYDALGKVAATLWFGTGEVLLGSEWAPETGEPMMIAGAFSKYFQASGINDIPPGAQLALILGSYALKRTTRPTIKSKLSGAMQWLKNRFKR